MLRGLAVLTAMATVTVSAAAASFAAGDQTSPRAANSRAATTITLRGRVDVVGPWRSYLWLKLRRGGIPVSFSVCALVDSKKIPPTCYPRPGATIPQGSRLRLEQRRGKGAWRVVGISTTPALDARLSNDVGGNRVGTVHYRVTLRSPNGTILRTSNPFKVIWHR